MSHPTVGAERERLRGAVLRGRLGLRPGGKASAEAYPPDARTTEPPLTGLAGQGLRPVWGPGEHTLPKHRLRGTG